MQTNVSKIGVRSLNVTVNSWYLRNYELRFAIDTRKIDYWKCAKEIGIGQDEGIARVVDYFSKCDKQPYNKITWTQKFSFRFH